MPNLSGTVKAFGGVGDCRWRVSCVLALLPRSIFKHGCQMHSCICCQIHRPYSALICLPAHSDYDSCQEIFCLIRFFLFRKKPFIVDNIYTGSTQNGHQKNELRQLKVIPLFNGTNNYNVACWFLWSQPYLIFVTFFTPTHFEAWKFYTQKCVNLRQKWLRDKTA